MNSDGLIFLELIGLFVLWIVVPLVPSILIYRIFPDTKVTVEGPLSGLTVRATGAFAGYVVTLLLAYPLHLKQYSVLGSQLAPVWTLKATVVAVDKDGKPITYANFYDGMRVSFLPDFEVVKGNSVTLKIPVDNEGRVWPRITFQLPSFGGATIDPSDYVNRMEIDAYNKEAKIHGEIPLQRFMPVGLGIGQAASAPPGS